MFLHLLIAIEYACTLLFTVKGQCPDYALVRASSVYFSSKDNIDSTRFPSGRTVDGDLLLIFSSNISDFRRSL